MRRGYAPRQPPTVASARSQIVTRPSVDEKFGSIFTLPKVDEVRDELNRFINASKEPAIVEAGQEPMPLVSGNYVLEQSSGRLFVESWTRDRTLSRRITGIVDRKRYSLTLSIEKFGKREGTIDIIDLAAPRASIGDSQGHPPDLSRTVSPFPEQTIPWMEDRRAQYCAGSGAQLVARVSSRFAPQRNHWIGRDRLPARCAGC